MVRLTSSTAELTAIMAKYVRANHLQTDSTYFRRQWVRQDITWEGRYDGDVAGEGLDPRMYEAEEDARVGVGMAAVGNTSRGGVATAGSSRASKTIELTRWNCANGSS